MMLRTINCEWHIQQFTDSEKTNTHLKEIHQPLRRFSLDSEVTGDLYLYFYLYSFHYFPISFPVKMSLLRIGKNIFNRPCAVSGKDHMLQGHLLQDKDFENQEIAAFATPRRGKGQWFSRRRRKGYRAQLQNQLQRWERKEVLSGRP